MRRFSLFATFCALVASIAVVIVGRSRANDPPPVAKSSNDNPFGGDGSPGPAQAPAATPVPPPTQPSAHSPQHSEESPQAGPRPCPPKPSVASPQPSGGVARAGVACVGPGHDSSVRVLTPEMAATREPQAIIGTDDSPAVAKISAALQSPTEITCRNTPLSDAVEQIEEAAQYRGPA